MRRGSGTDTTARMMMIRTRRNLGIDMTEVAKRGGSGAKTHQYALGRSRDGYTVLALTQTHLYTIARGKSPLKIDDMVGAYSFCSSVFDVWVMLVSGVVGFLMLRHGFGPAPLVMGLILGRLVEDSLSQSMIMFDNDWLRFFESPIVVDVLHRDHGRSRLAFARPSGPAVPRRT